MHPALLGKVAFGFPKAGLIRAWDPGSVSGSDVTSIAGAFGTNTALTLAGTSGSPDIVSAVSAGGRNVLKTSASNSEVGSFTTTGALSAWTMAFVLGGTDFSIDLPIASNSASSTNGYVRCVKNASSQLFRIEIRPDSGTASVMNFDTGQLISQSGGYLVVLTWDSVNGLVARVNTISKSLAKTGTFTFNRLFQWQNAGSPTYATAYWGRFALWNRVLLASEIAAVEGSKFGFGDDISNALYVSQSGDDASLSPYNALTPLKTIAAANAKTQLITNSLAIGNFTLYLKGGEEWSHEEIAPPASGPDLSRQYIVDSYGGGRAALHGCPATVGGWTVVGDGTFTRTDFATKPVMVAMPNGSANEGQLYDKLYDKTLGGTVPATYFDWNAGSHTLTIKPAMYFNAATTPCRILWDSSAPTQVYSSNKTNVTLRNFDAFFWYSIGFQPFISSGTVRTENIEVSYGFNDGIDASSTGGLIYHKNAKAHFAGGVPNISGTADGLSCHGASIVVYDGCHAFYNASGGLRSEQHVSETAINCWFKGNGRDVARIGQGAGVGGFMKLIGCLIEMTSASSTLNAIEVDLPTDTGANTAALLTVQACDIILKPGTVGQANAVVVNDNPISHVIQNTNMSGGFHGGVVCTGTATATEDYNNFDDTQIAVAGSVTQGGHSIAVTPGYADAANSNYALASNSPVKGKGIKITGIDNDYSGASFRTPPTIGFLEAA